MGFFKKVNKLKAMDGCPLLQKVEVLLPFGLLVLTQVMIVSPVQESTIMAGVKVILIALCSIGFDVGDITNTTIPNRACTHIIGYELDSTGVPPPL